MSVCLTRAHNTQPITHLIDLGPGHGFAAALHKEPIIYIFSDDCLLQLRLQRSQPKAGTGCCVCVCVSLCVYVCVCVCMCVYSSWCVGYVHANVLYVHTIVFCVPLY